MIKKLMEFVKRRKKITQADIEAFKTSGKIEIQTNEEPSVIREINQILMSVMKTGDDWEILFISDSKGDGKYQIRKGIDQKEIQMDAQKTETYFNRLCIMGDISYWKKGSSKGLVSIRFGGQPMKTLNILYEHNDDSRTIRISTQR